MRTLYLLSIIYIGLALTSCTSAESTAAAPQSGSSLTTPIPAPTCTTTKKNPLKVSLYNSKPKVPYTIIGKETISKFNMGGNKRQEATIRDGMRELAAAMGGDAVINIQHDAKTVTGTVVAYQKMPVATQG